MSGRENRTYASIGQMRAVCRVTEYRQRRDRATDAVRAAAVKVDLCSDAVP